MVWCNFRRAYDAKQTTYHACCRALSAFYWVDLRLFMRRPRRSMMLQGSHIMNLPAILWSSPPVHISGGRPLRARTLVWSRLFLLSGCSEVVWWWLLLRRRHSWALSLTVSNVVSSSSHICLVSLSLCAILGLPYSCPSAPASWSGHKWWCWSFGGVSSIYKDGCGYYWSKIKHTFSWADPSGIVSRALAVR